MILPCSLTLTSVPKLHLREDCSELQTSKWIQTQSFKNYGRVRLVTRSELNAINKIQAINTLAIRVVTYSFNIIDWQISEIRKMDKQERCLPWNE